VKEDREDDYAELKFAFAQYLDVFVAQGCEHLIDCKEHEYAVWNWREPGGCEEDELAAECCAYEIEAGGENGKVDNELHNHEWVEYGQTFAVEGDWTFGECFAGEYDEWEAIAD
jgi:hypothetical protein